jgi:hypothetical protein
VLMHMCCLQEQHMAELRMSPLINYAQAKQ